MRYHRKTAPGVRNGSVRKKNRWRREPDYTRSHQIRIERYSPRRGYRHHVSPTDVQAFLQLLPEWPELSIGLQRVVLSSDTTCLGWCEPGTVAVCAWEEQPWRIYDAEFYRDHAATFRRLGIRCRLQHPGIVQIYEVGEHDGHSYLALEFVPAAASPAGSAKTPGRQTRRRASSSSWLVPSTPPTRRAWCIAT